MRSPFLGRSSVRQLAAVALVFAAASSGRVSGALADDTAQAAGEARAKPPATGAAPSAPAPSTPASPSTPKTVHQKPAASPKSPLPVEMTIVAASPDPPWTLRIANTGDHPIRIAADTRLLTFELDTGAKHASKIKCAAPGGLRPGKFPNARELYLDPGESYVEDFDPRLYCFGKNLDALQGGTTVRAHLGWSGQSAKTRGPFAAEGTDRPQEFAALAELSAPPILLSYIPFSPEGEPLGSSPNSDTDVAQQQDQTKPPAGSEANADSGQPYDRANDPIWKGYRRAADIQSKGEKAEAEALSAKEWTKNWSNGKLPNDTNDTKPTSADRESSNGKANPTSNSPANYSGKVKPIDRNEGHVDIYVARYGDASAPRDIVLNIRAVNEGKRTLVSAIRGRMLSFTIEQLGPDNKPRRTVECLGSDGPHAMPTESIQDLGAGKAVTVPIMLAEICPADAFERPGLYRVKPRIDTDVDGELLEAHPYIGKALALQSSLVRIATSRKAFQDDEPKALAAQSNENHAPSSSTETGPKHP